HAGSAADDDDAFVLQSHNEPPNPGRHRLDAGASSKKIAGQIVSRFRETTLGPHQAANLALKTDDVGGQALNPGHEFFVFVLGLFEVNEDLALLDLHLYRGDFLDQGRLHPGCQGLLIYQPLGLGGGLKASAFQGAFDDVHRAVHRDVLDIDHQVIEAGVRGVDTIKVFAPFATL